MSSVGIVSMKNILNLIGGLLIAGLVGCGGGGGSGGTPSSGTGSTPVVTVTDPSVTATLTVSGFSLFLDKPVILNDGVDKSNITVVAVNAANNVVAGATVKVVSNNNSIFTPPALAVSDSTDRKSVV